MSQESIYDEDDAIRAIRESLSSEIKDKYSDDDIVEIIDALWDYYEDKGLLSLDNLDDDVEADDIEAIAGELYKTLRKNGPEGLTVEDLCQIIKGEQDYEESLEDIE
jgi:hypothetical protein